MGSSLSSLRPDFQQQFREAYSFVQLVEDSNYGLIKVYRKRQLNYDYVMVFEESLAGMPQQQIEQLCRQLELIVKYPHANFLRLFHYQLVQDNSCSGAGYLRLYLEYYNFTVRNLVEGNSRNKIYLDLEEILYILNSAVAAAEYLRSLGVGWVGIEASQIVLSPTGCVYFSPVRVGKSSVEMDLCGGCTLISATKYDRSLPIASNRDMRHQLKRLLLQLTQHYPKSILEQFQPLFLAIEMSQNIRTFDLPQSKASAIDMMKQMYHLQAPDDSDSEKQNKRQRHYDSSSTTRNSHVSNPPPRLQKQSLKQPSPSLYPVSYNLK